MLQKKEAAPAAPVPVPSASSAAERAAQYLPASAGLLSGSYKPASASVLSASHATGGGNIAISVPTPGKGGSPIAARHAADGGMPAGKRPAGLLLEVSAAAQEAAQEAAQGSSAAGEELGQQPSAEDRPPTPDPASPLDGVAGDGAVESSSGSCATLGDAASERGTSAAAALDRLRRASPAGSLASEASVAASGVEWAAAAAAAVGQRGQQLSARRQIRQAMGPEVEGEAPPQQRSCQLMPSPACLPGLTLRGSGRGWWCGSVAPRAARPVPPACLPACLCCSLVCFG